MAVFLLQCALIDVRVGHLLLTSPPFSILSSSPTVSMMHKVKDVVSKLFHPSFLFTASSDTDRPKRKRPDAAEQTEDEAPADIPERNGHTTASSSSRYQRPSREPAQEDLSDDDDDNEAENPLSSSRNGTGEERQNKRLRTGTYSHLLSTRTSTADQPDTRRYPLSTSTPTRAVTATSTEPKRYPFSAADALTTTTLSTVNESRFASSDREFYLPSADRTPKPNYDPWKSPLFSTRSQKTTNATSNVESNEHSANYLLATSLANRPNSPARADQPASATFSNPTSDQRNRFLSTDRHVFSSPYSSTYSRRLPYIERLRQRTLHDSVRLNQTLEQEDVTKPSAEVPKAAMTAAAPPPKQIKASEKECGVQCDIEMLEKASKSNEKPTQPPASTTVQKQTSSIPTSEQETTLPIQTKSSITIEKAQPSSTINLEITKPKVLGNITPFSWPKFARAQDDFAKKHPDKCSLEKPSASTIPERPAVTTTPSLSYMSNTAVTTTPKLPTLSTSAPSPVPQSNESVWKCSACTKENPIQASSCSLCHGANPNSNRSTSGKSSRPTEAKGVTGKQSDPKTSVIPPSFSTLTTTKDSQLPAPFGTGSALFTLKSTPPMSSPEKTNSSVTTDPPLISYAALPPFGTSSNIPFPITTKESSSSAAVPSLGALPAFSTSGITTSFNFGVPTTTSSFGLMTPKEKSTTTSTLPLFNLQQTVTSSVKTFQSGPQFAAAGTLPSTHLLPFSMSSAGPLLSGTPLESFKLSGALIPPVTSSDNSVPPPISSGISFDSPIINTPTTTSASASIFSVSDTNTFGSATAPAAPFSFGSSSSSFMFEPSSSTTTQSNATFNFGSSSSLFSSPQSTPALSASASAPQILPFGSPNAPPLFSFGSMFNSNSIPTPSSMTSGTLTGGFTYQAPTTPASIFSSAATEPIGAPFLFSETTASITPTESIAQPPNADASPRVFLRAKRRQT